MCHVSVLVYGLGLPINYLIVVHLLIYLGYFVPLGSGGQGQKPATSAKELEKMKQKHFSTEEEPLSSKIIDTEPVKGIRLLTLKRGTLSNYFSFGTFETLLGVHLL